MNRPQILDCSILIVGVALSRVALRSQYLYDLDSVNFALALETFDPQLYQPHPPGYFLYVLLGRFVQGALPDANTALVAIGIVASCGAMVGIYALANAWFGRKAAFAAGLLFLFSPLSWFHGIVALTYIVEVFFSATIGYLCWQTLLGRARFLLPSVVLLGVACGFRQSSILFLGPLWLFSSRKAPPRQVLLGLGLFIITVLAWFIPMMVESGGTEKYFRTLYSLWSAVPAQRTVFAYPLGQSIALLIARSCMILTTVRL